MAAAARENTKLLLFLQYYNYSTVFMREINKDLVSLTTSYSSFSKGSYSTVTLLFTQQERAEEGTVKESRISNTNNIII
jgi:hypothetical protein